MKKFYFYCLSFFIAMTLSSCGFLDSSDTITDNASEIDQDVNIDEMRAALPRAPQAATSATKINKTYDIGVIVPLTGDFSRIGVPFLNGLKLAKDEVNLKKGINGVEINLLVEDIPCEDVSALNNAKKRLSLLDVQLIISGGCSTDIRDLVEFSNNDEITNLVAFSNNFNEDSKSEYSFYLAPNQESFVLKVTDFIYKKLGISDLAVIYESNAFTDKIVDGIKTNYTRVSGKKLLFTEKNSKDKKGTDLINQIKDSKAKALLVISERPKSAAPLIKQIKEAKLDIPVIVNEAFAEKQILEEIGLESDGLIVFFPKLSESPKLEDFLMKYEKKYEEESSFPFYSANGYDTMMLVKQAIEWAGYKSESIKGYLLGVSFDDGLIGRIKFNKKGRLENLDYDVYLAKNGKLTPYDTTKPVGGLTLESGVKEIKVEEGVTGKSGEEMISNSKLIIIEE